MICNECDLIGGYCGSCNGQHWGKVNAITEARQICHEKGLHFISTNKDGTFTVTLTLEQLREL